MRRQNREKNNNRLSRYSATYEEESILIERSNSRRIERLEGDIAEIREDMASMPGRIVTELEKRHPAGENLSQIGWAFGVMLTLLGAVAAYVAMMTNMISDDIREHINSDGHPQTIAQMHGLLSSYDLFKEKLIKTEAEIAKLDDMSETYRLNNAEEMGALKSEVNRLIQDYDSISANNGFEIRDKINALEEKILQLDIQKRSYEIQQK